jgi:hypothetical protein
MLKTGTTDYVVGDTLTGAGGWSCVGAAKTASTVLSKYPTGVAVEKTMFNTMLSSVGINYNKGTNMLAVGIYNLYVAVVPDGSLSGAVGILGT